MREDSGDPNRQIFTNDGTGSAAHSADPKPRAVDLFAGAGGFSLAALEAGFDVIAAVENDRNACLTYRRNVVKKLSPSTNLFERDIRQLTPAEFVDATDLKSGGCDLVMGGPPCQGFSSHRLNDGGVGDDRNELLLRYFEFVAALRPKLFLVENVPGLLWPRHAEYLRRFREVAETNGYVWREPDKLNARDFGVPQNRRRVFILGVRQDFELTAAWPPATTHTSPKIVEDGSELPVWINASVAFVNVARPDDPNDVCMRSGITLTNLFKEIPYKGSRSHASRTLACHENYSGHSDVYGRIDPDRPGPTMTTACINPSKGRFVHPTEHHGITLRQAARLQTFPDWFDFEGGLMAGGAQVGNAVPLTLGKALLTVLSVQLSATSGQAACRPEKVP